MFTSWRVGRVAGIGIFIHWSFWLLPLWVGYEHWSQGPAQVALWVGLVLALFGSVLLHELGHAFMARAFGIGTRDITLYPIGGAARLERMSERPLEEILIALAGPAVNVVIAVVLLLGIKLADVPVDPEMLAGQGPVLPVFLVMLTVMNLFLVGFNLLPIFPMDGGRVFRALLTPLLGRLGATRAAVWVAVPLSLGLMALGYFGSAPMMIVVALFVILVGQAELAMVRYQEARRRAEEHEEEVPEAWPVETEVHASAFPVEPGFSGFTWDRQAHLWIEWRQGRPVCAVPAGPRW
jgi:Zn-dependent protease